MDASIRVMTSVKNMVTELDKYAHNFPWKTVAYGITGIVSCSLGLFAVTLQNYTIGIALTSAGVLAIKRAITIYRRNEFKFDSPIPEPKLVPAPVPAPTATTTTTTTTTAKTDQSATTVLLSNPLPIPVLTPVPKTTFQSTVDKTVQLVQAPLTLSPGPLIPLKKNTASGNSFPWKFPNFAFQVLDKFINIPHVRWDKIDPLSHALADPKQEESLALLQNVLKEKTKEILTGYSLILNKKGFVKGIDVKKTQDIDYVKKQIGLYIGNNEKDMTTLFEILSSAGMAGYADQMRTSLAGLGIKASDLLGSVKFDVYPKIGGGKNNPEVHEDYWTKAIRDGNEHFREHYVSQRNLTSLKSAIASYQITEFDKWDHTKLYKNEELRQAVLKSCLDNLDVVHIAGKTTVGKFVQLLKKIIFLHPQTAWSIFRNLKGVSPAETETVSKELKTAFDKRLDVLGQKENYYKNKQDMEERVEGLLFLSKSFGKGKVHPLSIKVATTEKPIKTIIQELQNANVIGPTEDSEGFYPLLQGSKAFIHTIGFQSEKGRIKTVLELAEGNITNRYAARRLAPTFYQGSTSNENFDLPRQKLPLLLQYEDLRFKVAEETKNRFMELLGVTWDFKTAQFSVVDQNKFDFIKNNALAADLPVGPSVVSVFLDSIASLGEAKWASDLCTLLETHAKNEHWRPAVQNQEKLFNNAMSEQNQFQGFPKLVDLKQPMIVTGMPITEIQEAEYQNRRDRILKLHNEGLLHIRGINPDNKELLSETGIYTGKWLLSQGPNLSTTLIPKAGSPIKMSFFTDGSRAIIIDPFAVTPEYFGNGFFTNAVTQYQNFETVLKKRQDGQPIEIIQAGLAKESAMLEVGQGNKERGHTEIAFFRPAERNLVTGLFFKVNDENFAGNLRALIELQNAILQTYGLFLPLFAYKDSIFQEVAVDSVTLQALGIANKGIPLRTLGPKEKQRKIDRPHEYFNLYGEMDTQMIIAAKEKMSVLPQVAKKEHDKHKENFIKLFDLQLMLLQIKGPQDKISFTMSTTFKIEEFVDKYLKDYQGDKGKLLAYIKEEDRQIDDIVKILMAEKYGEVDIRARIAVYQALIDKERPVDLSVIDNLHLVFPTVFQTGNTSAEAQDLFFSHSLFTRFLRTTPDYAQFWLQMARRNMKVFLGIDLQVDMKGEITTVACDKKFLSYFKDSNDPSGKKQYAKCISRLVQMLRLLDKEEWARAITINLRNDLGADFGQDGNIDFFQSSDEIKQIDLYLKDLANPNFEEIKKLPNSHGTTSSYFHMSNQQRGRFANMSPIVTGTVPPAGGRFAGRQNVQTRPSPHIPKIDPAKTKQALNDLYNHVWKNNTTSFLNMERDRLAKETGLFENGTYRDAVLYDVVGAEFDSLQAEGAYQDTKMNADSVQVFHNDKLVPSEILELLTKTAVRTTNGDLDLLLQNGHKTMEPQDKAYFLNDQERRIKRSSMVLAGRVTVTAKGGYNSPREKLDKKISVIFVNTAAPQFEKYGMKDGELEVVDFIVKKGAPSHQDFEKQWKIVDGQIALYKARGSKAPLDSLRNDKGLLILHEEHPRSLEADVVRLRNGDFYLMSTFKEEMETYLKDLVLPSIKQMVAGDGRPTYLKATALGAGFFASLGLNHNFQTSLQKYILESLLKTYERLINQGQFNKGDVIEFPFYNVKSMPQSLKDAAANAGVEVIWRKNRDLLDFSPVTSVQNKPINPELFNRVVLNAGDSFSFGGNEGASESVEAMFANNSDLRMVSNWHFNPNILDLKRYQRVHATQTK